MAADDRVLMIFQELAARPRLFGLLAELIKDAMPAIEAGGEQARQQELYAAEILVEKLLYERRCRDAGIAFNPFLDKPVKEIRKVLREARRLHEGKLAHAEPATRLVQ